MVCRCGSGGIGQVLANLNLSLDVAAFIQPSGSCRCLSSSSCAATRLRRLAQRAYHSSAYASKSLRGGRRPELQRVGSQQRIGNPADPPSASRRACHASLTPRRRRTVQPRRSASPQKAWSRITSTSRSLLATLTDSTSSRSDSTLQVPPDFDHREQQGWRQRFRYPRMWPTTTSPA